MMPSTLASCIQITAVLAKSALLRESDILENFQILLKLVTTPFI
jgi:hypothetical protein